MVKPDHEFLMEEAKNHHHQTANVTEVWTPVYVGLRLQFMLSSR